MLTVNSCLCFKLETGGLIIGWLNLISSIIIAIISIIMVILSCIVDCEALVKSFNTDTGSCSTVRGVLIGVCVVIFAICIGFAIIAHKCIKGVKTRNHSLVKPMMIWLGIVAVLSILNVFAFTARGIVSGVISAAINAYWFIVIYSLYTLLRQEFERGNANTQYQTPNLKV